MGVTTTLTKQRERDTPAAPATATGAPRQSSRDPYLDLVRAWAILRVVLVHILGTAPVAMLWWPAPTFVAPGMPLVFFVSGALAAKSLGSSGRSSTTLGFWHDRFRRLLLPYWAFLLVPVTMALVLDATHRGDLYTVSYARTVLAFVPFIDPITSPMGFNGVVHLWFLVVIAWMMLLAPGLVWLHRRVPWLLLAGALAFWWGTAWRSEHDHAFVFAEVSAAALFMFFFVLGFWYTDGKLVSGVVPHDRGGPSPGRGALDGWRGLVAGAFAIGASWLVWQWEHPLAVQASIAVHGLLGLGWLCWILAARPGLVRVAQSIPRLLNLITRRTLTIYLWGWPCAALAAWAVNDRGLPTPVALGLFLLIAIGGLAVVVVVFGPVEDFAARRRGGRHRTRAASGTSGTSGTGEASATSGGRDQAHPRVAGVPPASTPTLGPWSQLRSESSTPASVD